VNTHEMDRWLEHDGTVVTIDTYAHTLKVSVYEAIYPYPHMVCRVMAEPLDKQSAWYRGLKQQLGDDWSTDVLGSDIDVTVSVMQQLGW